MRFLVLAALVLAPLQAHALSCLRPSVARSYLEAAQADEAYVVVRGSLTFNARALPKTSGAGQRTPAKMTKIPARLRGVSLSKSGFDLPFDRNVTLEIACFGPWCGSAPVKSEVLVFVRRDAGAYNIGINPCGGFLFDQPKRSMIRDVIECHQGGRCVAKNR